MLAGHDAVPGRAQTASARQARVAAGPRPGNVQRTANGQRGATTQRAASGQRGASGARETGASRGGAQSGPVQRPAATRRPTPAATRYAPGRTSSAPRRSDRDGLRGHADRLRRRATAGAAATKRTLLGAVPQRFHAITSEMAKFGTIGLINLGVNFAVFNALLLLPIMAGAEVKSKAAATIVATTCAYFLNRYWTYRNRPKTTLRREYALFFFFNAIGLVIETAFVAMAKYGFHETHFVVLNICSFLGIAVGTIFRFWAYRTHVFKPEAPAEAKNEKPVKAEAVVERRRALPAVAAAGIDEELEGELVQLEFDELIHDETDRAPRR